MKLTNILTALGEAPTTAKVRGLIRAVAKWRNLATIYGTEANLRKADEMLANLNNVIESMGARVMKPGLGAGKRMCR